MNKSIIIGIAAVVVVGGGGYLLLHKSSMTKSNTTTSTTKTPAASTSTDTSGDSTSATAMSKTITANDSSASPEVINATKGQKVTLTFNVSTNGTYHGGLEFKSADPSVDSGPIAEGSSKSVTFTATKSFKFTPYWYQSNVQKDYFVTVNVQ